MRTANASKLSAVAVSTVERKPYTDWNVRGCPRVTPPSGPQVSFHYRTASGSGRASLPVAAAHLVPSGRGEFSLRVDPKRAGFKPRPGWRTRSGTFLSALTEADAAALRAVGVALEVRERKARAPKAEPEGDFDYTAES